VRHKKRPGSTISLYAPPKNMLVTDSSPTTAWSRAVGLLVYDTVPRAIGFLGAAAQCGLQFCVFKGCQALIRDRGASSVPQFMGAIAGICVAWQLRYFVEALAHGAVYAHDQIVCGFGKGLGYERTMDNYLRDKGDLSAGIDLVFGIPSKLQRLCSLRPHHVKAMGCVFKTEGAPMAFFTLAVALRGFAIGSMCYVLA
jgi:hypothetical protein